MIIITGHLTVPPEDRDRFVFAMQDMVRRARLFDGCVDLAIAADPSDRQRVQNVEVWRDTEALEAWRAQADPPDLDVRVLSDEVHRYDAEDGGPMFPEPSG